MNPGLALVSDGKKFMWDGRSYEDREEAARVAESYRQNGFEVCMMEEGGKFLVHTRRVVKEVVVPAQ